MAVTANQLIERSEGCKESIPAAAVNIYGGTLVFEDVATGYGTNTTNSGANPFFGVATKQCDNSGGAAADLKAEVWRDGVFYGFSCSGMAQTDVGKPVYASDNFTITLTQSATAVYIGTISQFVSATKVGVEINPSRSVGVAAALTEITHTAPGTPDYAVQDLINSSAYGFVTKDEGNTVMSVIKNLQQRVAALEAR